MKNIRIKKLISFVMAFFMLLTLQPTPSNAKNFSAIEALSEGNEYTASDYLEENGYTTSDYSEDMSIDKSEEVSYEESEGVVYEESEEVFEEVFEAELESSSEEVSDEASQGMSEADFSEVSDEASQGMSETDFSEVSDEASQEMSEADFSEASDEASQEMSVSASEEATEESVVEECYAALPSTMTLENLASEASSATPSASIVLDGNKIKVDGAGLVLLSNLPNFDFTNYTIYLNSLGGNYVDATQAVTLNGVKYSFVSLGTGKKFAGDIECQQAEYGLILDKPLFNEIDLTNVQITTMTTLKIKSKNDSMIMLANTMTGTSDSTWESLSLVMETYTDSETFVTTSPGPCINKLDGNLKIAGVSYQADAGDTITISSTSNLNLGLLSNYVTGNKTLSVGKFELSEGANLSISTNDASAGVLVGTMDTGVTLSVGDADNPVIIDDRFTVTAKWAGGIIGNCTDVKLGGLYVTVDGATICGSDKGDGLGGLIGKYFIRTEDTLVYSEYDGGASSHITVSNVNFRAKNKPKMGGIFGYLYLYADFTIKNADTKSKLLEVSNPSDTYYGGLVGYARTDTSNPEKLYGLTITDSSPVIDNGNLSIKYFGGALGAVGVGGSINNVGSYVKICGDFTPTLIGTMAMNNASYYAGGIISLINSNSVVEIAEDAYFKPTFTSKLLYGGGVAGYMCIASTLCLNGTTDLSALEIYGEYNSAYKVLENSTTGQIVGNNEAGLCYAKKNWKLIRPAAVTIDDIGNYGEVIRLGKNIGKGSDNLGTGEGLSEDLIYQDETSHRTTFKTGSVPVLTDGKLTISNTDQFAVAAINEQMRNGFKLYNVATIPDNLMKFVNEIEITGDIDLTNTGIIGIQRDSNSYFYYYTGIINANRHSIKLAIGELYGYRLTDGTDVTETEPGGGQIHGHIRVGLFAGFNGTAKDITLDGKVNFWFRRGRQIEFGGIGAMSYEHESTYDGIVCNFSVVCRMTDYTSTSHLGGLIGYKNKPDLTKETHIDPSLNSITIKKCIGNATFECIDTYGREYIGGLIGYIASAGDISIENVTLSGSISEKLKLASDRNYAYTGGLIAYINGYERRDLVTMTIKNLTCNGQKVTCEGLYSKDSPTTSGGLLGNRWKNVNVIFGTSKEAGDGLLVTGNSLVSVDGNANTAGLVCLANGYWQVNDIRFDSFTVKGGEGDLGLLVDYTKEDQSIDGATRKYQLYVEETAYQAYYINPDGVNVSKTEASGKVFDEWVARPSTGSTDVLNTNYNSVISIATPDGGRVAGKRVGVNPSSDLCTTYQNRTTYGQTVAQNPSSRYYYDLDVIREFALTRVDGKIDTPEELLLWSVYHYALNETRNTEDEIDSYFKTADTASGTIDGNGAEIDLTGYSYYPVTVNAKNVTLKNITIKLDNKTIETAENLNGGGQDSVVRSTTVSDNTTHTQHYLMHCGLIYNYINTSNSYNSTFKVNNVTLQGNTGRANNTSGALIFNNLGETINSSSPHFARLDINGLVLDGLYINSNVANTGYAPLVVNKLSNYSSTSVQKVSTKNYEGYNTTNNSAASSLIGKAGGSSTTSNNISVAFYNNIDLSGRRGDWKADGTGGSIFKRATLLESFIVSDANSSGYYHFNYDEICTYGVEIKNSIQYAGLQLYYYDTPADSSNPILTTDSYTTAGAAGDFNKNTYLKYVATDCNVANKSYEIEVNISKPDLDEGCGTFDDPYIIKSAAQLQLLTKFMNGGSATTGWKVNIVDNPDKVKTASDTNHILYEAGTSEWDDAVIREYIGGAYYKVGNVEKLVLDDFAGFGTMAYPFRGVFDGNEKKIIINVAKNDAGFVHVSYGCVVQNVSIEYYGAKTISLSKPNGFANSRNILEGSYFGGIIGNVPGGDSIVDNVLVEYASGVEGLADFSLTTKSDFHMAGGFVGIIQGGGVVFKNMPSQAGLSSTSTNYYVSKYIGRVLDGYAINETNKGTVSSTFSGDNYSIPDINGEGASLPGKLSWNNGNVSIGNAEQLVIFTDIINSGAANERATLAYGAANAKTRNADYSQIGSITSETDTAFVTSRLDDTVLGTGSYPYLITKYADENFYDICAATPKDVSITFTGDIDVSPYGNGYRAIGGRYNCYATRTSLTSVTYASLEYNTPVIKSVDGGNHKIRVKCDAKEYSDDPFRTNAEGGLFNIIRHNGATISDINVYGTIKNDVGFKGTGTSGATILYRTTSVGGVAGRDYCPGTSFKKLNLNHVSFGNDSVRSTVYSDVFAGGLIGSSGSYRYYYIFNDAASNYSSVTATNCSYNNADITGGYSAGGFFGDMTNNYKYFIRFNESVESIPVATDKSNYHQILVTDGDVITGNNSVIRNFVTAYGVDYNDSTKDYTGNGVGGLVGTINASLSVVGTENSYVKLNNITTTGEWNQARVGGVVGFVGNNSTKMRLEIAYVEVAGLSTVNPDNTKLEVNNAGGIVATWYSGVANNVGDPNGGYLPCVTIKYAYVKDSVIKGKCSGGVYAYSSKSATLASNITVEGTTFTSSSTTCGGIIGSCSADLYGENILLKELTFTYPAKAGRFAGSASNFRVYGVAVHQTDVSKLPAKDIYSRPYYNINDSIMSDTTKVTYFQGSVKNYVSYDAYDNEDITRGEDLATKPTVNIPGLTNLLGDTLYPETVVKAAANTSLYQNVYVANQLVSDTNRVVSGIESTYNAQQDNLLAADTDFSVLLVDGDARVVHQYLNVATNGGFDTLMYFDSKMPSTRKDYRTTITIERYVKDDGADTFTKADPAEYPATLKYNKTTGEFTTTAYYDNQKDTFTLVTFSTTGPGCCESRTIHIPIIVRRMLQVDFIATMASGTVFNAGEMVNYTTHALASKGEDITGYLTFMYNSNVSNLLEPANYDWQNYMESGGDLLGHYNKSVDTGTTVLPAGTKITLIDCQNEDRRYYATVGSGGSKLELFNGGNLNFTASDGTEFEPQSLSELLQITAEKNEENAGLWIKLSDKQDATVYAYDGVNYNYYRLKTDSDTVDESYDLTIGNTKPVENYFVVINVPQAESHKLTLSKKGMVWSSSETSGVPTDVHQLHRYNMQSLKTGESEASFNYLENYSQTITDLTGDDSVGITANDAAVNMPVLATNRISFDVNNYTSTDPLFQQFSVRLKKTENGETSSVAFPSDAYAEEVKLYAYYIGDDGNKHYFVVGTTVDENGITKNVLEPYTGSDGKAAAVTYEWTAGNDGIMILPFATSADAGYDDYIDLSPLREVAKFYGESGGKDVRIFYLEVEANVDISYVSVAKNDTIPVNDSSDLTISNYTQTDFYSYMSFTRSGLSSSTLRADTTGRDTIRKYYLTEKLEAILKLDYVNVDQLGINVGEDESSDIDTVVTLDMSNAEGFDNDVTKFKLLSESDTLVFTFSLEQKGGISDVTSINYRGVPIGEYMKTMKLSDVPDGVTVGDLSAGQYQITLTKNADGSYPYYNAASGTFSIPVRFTVKTSDVKLYANYHIVAAVKLYAEGEDKELSVNTQGASITYTFAKIDVSGVWKEN